MDTFGHGLVGEFDGKGGLGLHSSPLLDSVVSLVF